jgi:hypothetical protein
MGRMPICTADAHCPVRCFWHAVLNAQISTDSKVGCVFTNTPLMMRRRRILRVVNGLKQGDLNIVTLSWQTNEQIWDAIRKILDECNKYSDKNPTNPLPTIGHYIVMVGYDSGIDKFYFLDPGSLVPDQLTEYFRAQFTQYWEKQPNFIIPARSVTIVR